MAQGKQDDGKKTVIGQPFTEPHETLPPTRLAGDQEPPTRPAAQAGGGNQTRIVFGTPELPPTATPRADPTVPTTPALRDAAFTLPDGPVVGWLVVVAGPGRGSAKEIHIGINMIGREPHNRIVLDFGDAAISREKAAGIAYDPIDHSFAVMPGESANIVRHNATKVLSPHELAPGDTITIGQTELRFVPLCGPDFHWEQE